MTCETEAKPELSYFFYWHKLPVDAHESFMWEWAENGAGFLTLPWQLLKQFHQGIVSAKDLAEKAARCGLRIINAHAPYGKGYCINPAEEDCRREQLAAQQECMRIAADLGARTYTLHLESSPYGENPLDLEHLARLSSDSAARSLEMLLPLAEKLELILAVENCFSPYNTADQVIDCISRFDSPWIGCCYDAGHANLMTSGKDASRYSPYVRYYFWRDKIVPEDHTLEKLAPHIVTCHLHDNNGFSDQHGLPGTGCIDWESLMPRLAKCPRIRSLQSEVDLFAHRIPVSRVCRIFNELKTHSLATKTEG